MRKTPASVVIRLILLSAAVPYLAYLALVYSWQTSLIYPGMRNEVADTPPSAPGLEVVHLSSAAGVTEAFFLPATSADPGPHPAVIFAHGNGEVIDFWVKSLEGFRERGIGVLLVEYPGYGRSGGTPSESSIRATLGAAYDHVAADPRIDAQRIFGFGWSLGGGAICLLARDRPLRALILQSTFPSLSELAAKFWAPAFLMRDRYDNVMALRSFPGPALVIHGRDDRLIPWQSGKRLAAAAKRATFRLYDCGHGCWDPNRNSFWKDADALLESAGILANKSQANIPVDATWFASPREE